MTQDDILRFDTSLDPPGIEVIDTVEQLRYVLHCGEPVSLEHIPSDEFTFPVGTGLRIETSELILPNDVAVFVRDSAGGMITEFESFEEESFPAGSYILEISPQIKTYVELDGPFDLTSTLFDTRCSFDGPKTVDLGFRSRHTRPAATVTTTSDPFDVMQALNTFSSALKTTSPERSFPTLRGHPPRVELGSELSIPDGLTQPETGIQVEIPPTLETLYQAAPLAYYLGAEMVPGSTPRIVTDSGFEQPLSRPEGLCRTIERTLKQVFLLDCVTRTEGLYQIELYERNELDRRLGLDWGLLYDRSPSKRLESYLSVPFEYLDDLIPEWRLTAHVEPVPDTVRQLPFVVNDLAVVRTVDDVPAADTGATATLREPVEKTKMTRSSSGALQQTRSTAEPTNTRSTAEPTETRSTTEPPTTESFVQPESTDSLEQAWIGDRIPIGASKLTIDAFHNRLEREITSGDIEITIVLNDSRMDEERSLVKEAYGDRDDLPFDIRVCQGLTVDQLHDRLQENRDFFHYIGHIDEEGFECIDGKFDAATLEETGVDAFLLNACRSYDQGLRLIEAGAMGGIVTLAEVVSDRAVRVGELIARLLNVGFPLRAALSIAREETVLGGQYIVVGDGGMTLTQPQSRTPNLPEITRNGDQCTVEIRTFATDSAGLGSMYAPYLCQNNTFFLTSGMLPPFTVDTKELRDFLALEDVPVRMGDDNLSWSSSITL